MTHNAENGAPRIRDDAPANPRPSAEKDAPMKPCNEKTEHLRGEWDQRWFTACGVPEDDSSVSFAHPDDVNCPACVNTSAYQNACARLDDEEDGLVASDQNGETQDGPRYRLVIHLKNAAEVGRRLRELIPASGDVSLTYLADQLQHGGQYRHVDAGGGWCACGQRACPDCDHHPCCCVDTPGGY